jgi:hypothetical protein
LRKEAFFAGPCDIPEPSDIAGKYKYKAWKAHGEMTKEEAAKNYVDLIKQFESGGGGQQQDEKEKDGASWALAKPKFQYGAVGDAAALRAKSNFGGTLEMKLATSLTARALKPILDPNSPGDATPVRIA